MLKGYFLTLRLIARSCSAVNSAFCSRLRLLWLSLSKSPILRSRLFPGIILLALMANFSFISLAQAATTIEQVNLSRDQNALRMLIDSNAPIQYQFDTKKKGAAISWSLKGADYYQALTDYFTVFDVDSLVNCLDNLVIVPVSKTAARFEADLGPGLMASVEESKAPNGSYRLIMKVSARKGAAPCFSRPIPAALVAAEGLFDAPAAASDSRSQSVTVTPVLPQAQAALPVPEAEMAATPEHELTAEEIVKAQQQQRLQQLEAQKKQRRIVGMASDTELQEHFEKEISASSYVVNADILWDKLNYSNKGGVKGINWLQKYGDSELREIDAGISNPLARFPYHLSMQSYTQYIKDGVRVDERKAVLNRAWVGYRLSPTLSLKAGIMYEPYSGDSTSDLAALPFMERGLSTYLGPQYNPGVLLSYHGSFWGLDIGGFGQRSETPDTSQSSTIRLSYRAPISVSNIASFEVSFSKAKLVDDTLAIAATPEVNLILPTMYSAYQSQVDSVTRNSLAATWIFHGLNYSAQVAQLKLDTPNPGISDLSAKNLWFTWFSGETPRRRQGSKWLPLRSQKSLSEVDWKSWELGFRYSALEDNTEEHLITKTLVLNWYVNKFVTIKNDYIFATQVASPNNPAVPIDNDADLFVTRVQVSW